MWAGAAAAVAAVDRFLAPSLQERKRSLCPKPWSSREPDELAYCNTLGNELSWLFLVAGLIKRPFGVAQYLLNQTSK